MKVIDSYLLYILWKVSNQYITVIPKYNDFKSIIIITKITISFCTNLE